MQEGTWPVTADITGRPKKKNTKIVARTKIKKKGVSQQSGIRESKEGCGGGHHSDDKRNERSTVGRNAGQTTRGSSG